MLKAWYFRWVVVGIILWVGGLAVGLALLPGGPGTGRRAGIKVHSRASRSAVGRQMPPEKLGHHGKIPRLWSKADEH